jgi:hypothetical protein
MSIERWRSANFFGRTYSIYSEDSNMSRRAHIQKTVALHDLFLNLQQQMVAQLWTDREVISHPGTMGDAAELHWLTMLNAYFPKRYCANKAFVVDCYGQLSEQIDVVVYDRQYSPFLFNQDNAMYVPAESVYAVFEVKQELSSSQVKYAMQKAASVRRLRRTSVSIPHAGGIYPPKKPPHILAGILTLESQWKSPFGQPFQKKLADEPREGRLDLGCALKQGAFEVRYSSRGRLRVMTSGQGTALIFFFLRLLARLQESGTAVALDFDSYGQFLGGDQ